LHQRVGGMAVIEGQLRVLAGVGSMSMLQFAEAPGLGLVHLGGIEPALLLHRNCTIHSLEARRPDDGITGMKNSTQDGT
jgi:hypothetical protein